MAAAAAAACFCAGAGAQQTVRKDSTPASALLFWFAPNSPPERYVPPGWRRDALGNQLVTRGRGSPRRVVACGLDQGPAYVVSEITDLGFVRLQRAGPAPPHPLWDQFHEGQLLRVRTRSGASVPAVAAVRSTHLARGAGAQDPPTTVADLWLDLGARSRADVSRLGVHLLDPVERAWPAWAFGDVVAGQHIAERAACAAVVAAAAGTPASGQTTFVLSAMSNFGWSGLLGALSALETPDSVFLVRATGTSRDQAPPPGLRAGAFGVVTVFDSAIRFRGTLAESAPLAAAAAAIERVSRAAGVSPPTVSQSFSESWRAVGDWWREPGTDSVSRAASLLGGLAKTAGVAGHEAMVRRAVIAELPRWAASSAAVDSAGNLIVAVGPERDTAVFVAHLDEVGYEVTGFDRSGTVSLRTRGGFYQSLWEGQPAELYLEDTSAAPLRGVFVPRDSASVRLPRAVTAWFGLDSAQLVARGVRPGQQVVAYKHPMRLAGTRMTARAVDDRAGTAALIMALRQLDPSKLRRKVIFAWSVREETGLEGARVLAAAFGRTTRRVYAVDTFVSSDSPLESTRFAYAPLGAGAVVRALDNSSVTPPDEVDRVTAAARRRGIPIQVGTTNGGNDGSVFVPYGAVDIPLSWPGRYSHSPVEVLDLRDLLALARLVTTLATDD